MASLRDIKRRIKGIKSTSQVTKAMQMIAAAKMRRAQEQVIASRQFAEKAWEIMTHLANQPGAKNAIHPLLDERPVKKVLVVLYTSDRGLAGGYNTNIIRATTEFIHNFDVPVALLTIGRKGRDFFAKSQREIVAQFDDIPDRPTVIDILPITEIVINDYMEEKFDEVYLAYNDFVNTITQRPVVRRLLPLSADSEELAVSGHIAGQQTLAKEYIYEPKPEQLLNTILPTFTELQIYQGLLESLASEHSARMVAMRAATDNANELVADLTLTYNRLRQEAITKEILDIVGGAEALNN